MFTPPRLQLHAPYHDKQQTNKEPFHIAKLSALDTIEFIQQQQQQQQQHQQQHQQHHHQQAIVPLQGIGFVVATLMGASIGTDI